MNNKATTVIGIFLLVFTLVIVGAVSAKTLDQEFANSNPVQNDISVQATLAAYETRQKAYDALLEQANQQLMDANATLAAISESNGTETPTESAGITPEEAIEIANEVAFSHETQVGLPELVNFEGTVAYEVKYDQGAIYVGFATGEILLNGTISLTQDITLDQATEIAKDYLGLSSIYLSDVVSINGQQLYRVIFNAGHIVYIDHNGQIIYVQMYSAADQTPTTTENSDSNDDQQHSYDDDDDDDDDEKEHDD